MAKTKYLYISKRTTPSQNGYIVQYKGSTIGGFHESLEAACTTLMAKLGVRRISQLPLRNSSGAWKYKRRANKPSALLRRARRLLEYAAARQARVPKVVAPAADLLASLDHVPLSKPMYEDEAALHFVSLHLKYKPSKDNLRDAWRLVSRTSESRVRGLAARVLFLRRVLITCARLMAESPFAMAWPQNCNRWRHREQGPIATLKSLKIIKKPSRLAKKTKPLLFFGEGHEDDLDLGWILVPASATALETLTSFVRGVDLLVKAVGAAPRTCTEWNSKMRAANNALGRFAPPRLSGQYLRPWITRGYMIDLMRKSRVRRVRVDPEITIHGFLRMNPDQHATLQRIYMRFIKRGDDVNSVKQFVRLFSVRQIRLELLSMYLCFADDKGFRDEDFNDFDLDAWLTTAAELCAESGVEPRPVLVAQKLRDQSSESSSSE